MAAGIVRGGPARAGLAPRGTAGAAWRCRHAGGRAGRPAPRPAAARRLPVPRPCGRRCSATWRTVRSRCCSSTAAATPRSPCAAPAATASPARTARPGWSRTACAAGCSATIAATPCPRRSTARAAAASACWRPRVRASSGWPRSWASILPKARLAVMTSDTRRRRAGRRPRWSRPWSATRSTC